MNHGWRLHETSSGAWAATVISTAIATFREPVWCCSSILALGSAADPRVQDAAAADRTSVPHTADQSAVEAREARAKSTAVLLLDQPDRSVLTEGIGRDSRSAVWAEISGLPDVVDAFREVASS
jgi:hypothetical protein